jgi:hypothetical protein
MFFNFIDFCLITYYVFLLYSFLYADEDYNFFSQPYFCFYAQISINCMFIFIYFVNLNLIFLLLGFHLVLSGKKGINVVILNFSSYSNIPLPGRNFWLLILYGRNSYWNINVDKIFLLLFCLKIKTPFSFHDFYF